MSGPSRFLDALARRPLVLDAAMGTRLIARGLDLSKGDPALWNLDRPEDVLDIHRRDVGAGADAVLTNTFGADRISLGRLGRSADVGLINRRAVELAREAAGSNRFVIGSVGPKAAHDDGASREHVFALAESGADALIFETHTYHAARARLESLGDPLPLPVLVTLSDWDELSRTESSVVGLSSTHGLGRVDGVSAFGSNCLLGMEETLPLTKWLRGKVDLPLIAKPSAGLPHQEPASPESFAAAVPVLLALGVRLIGGCCGTTEAHVAAVRQAIDTAMASEGSAEWNIWRRADGPVGTPP